MSKVKLAILALILAIIIWSAGAPIFKWSLQEVQPLHLAFLRFFIPLLLLLPFIRKVEKIRPKDIIFVILLGLFDRVLNIGFFLVGLTYAPSINQAIIACSGPVFIILGSGIFLKEKITKKMLLGNVIGLTGVLFIVVQPALGTQNGPLAILGNTFFIISTIAAATASLITRKLAQRYSPLTLLFWTFLIGSISFLPAVVPSLDMHTVTSYLSGKALIGIFYGAILSSLLAYFLFFWALKYIQASQTTIFTYMDPVVTALVAIPLLHEYPSPIYILGSFLVFFGIFVAEGRIHYHPIHLLFKRRPLALSTKHG